MKIVLERAIAVGDAWVAALVGQTVQRCATAHRLVVTADKRPVAFLFGRNGRLTAFTTAGDPLAEDEVERWCPGATEQFMRSRPPREAQGPAGPQPLRSGQRPST